MVSPVVVGSDALQVQSGGVVLHNFDPLSSSMTAFNDLPLEVLPDIVRHVAKPKTLASFCLVNKAFYKFASPFLYHTIAVLSWHHEEKVLIASYLFGYLKSFDPLVPKIIRLFHTLSISPELAKHVRELGDPIPVRQIRARTDGWH